MARHKARLLKNGRNAGSTAFVMLDNYVFDSEAYRRMKVGPRALLWELIRRHNGSNNGSIGLGIREAAARLGVNKDTASGYFRALVDHGFVAPARLGGFNMKDPQSRRASEWRLTWIKTDCMTATKDFMAYTQKSTVRKIRTEGPEKTDSGGKSRPDRPKNPDLSAQFRRPTGPKKPDTYTSSHRRRAFTGPPDRSPCASTWAAIRNAIQTMEVRA
jgi:DNA-binding transcriptional regulator YhcF (GntR family)